MLISTLNLRTVASLAVYVSLIACHQGVQQGATPRAAAQPKVSTACATLQPYLDSLQRPGRAPGLSPGVTMPDGGSCGIVAGLADTAHRTPLQAQSLLLSGSIGKT